MARAEAHKWEFKARFRRHAFGWRSQPAIQRVKQAVTEIRKVARKDPVLAAEGAVTFLERISPALEHVDSSSGAIGTAVNNAIAELVPIIAGAPADATTRDAWLERLWEAHEADQIPYIERLADHWGELCASKEVASAWADRLVDITRMALSPDRSLRGHFHGTSACLSALYRAERYAEIVDLLQADTIWPYKRWAVKALAAMGRKAEAIRYAESCRGPWTDDGEVDLACEEILLSSGLVDEAYERYGLRANRGGTYLATFRAVAGSTRTRPRRHPRRPREDDAGRRGQVVRRRQGGGLYDEALALASRTPCDPKTLTRAARDLAEAQPAFADARRPARAPLARAGLRLRDHGRRRVGGLLEHDQGGGDEREAATRSASASGRSSAARSRVASSRGSSDGSSAVRERALVHVAGPGSRQDDVRRGDARRPRTAARSSSRRAASGRRRAAALRGGRHARRPLRLPGGDASDAFFMTRLMEDYSEAVVLEGDNPLEFVDLAVFVAPAPAPGRTLFVRRKRDRAKEERAKADALERLLRRPDGVAELLGQMIGGPIVELARANPRLLEEARAKLLAGIAQARKAPAPGPTEHWALAEGYEGIEHAQLVVVNIRAEAERPRAEELVADVGRLRKDAALFDDILGSRGTRIPVTAVVANLADPEDRDRKKALARVRRAIASRL